MVTCIYEQALAFSQKTNIVICQIDLVRQTDTIVQKLRVARFTLTLWHFYDLIEIELRGKSWLAGVKVFYRECTLAYSQSRSWDMCGKLFWLNCNHYFYEMCDNLFGRAGTLYPENPLGVPLPENPVPEWIVTKVTGSCIEKYQTWFKINNCLKKLRDKSRGFLIAVNFIWPDHLLRNYGRTWHS